MTLNGAGSSDPDGDALSYAWTSGPSVTLTGASTASPTFTAPQVTTDRYLVFTLTVSDGDLSATDTVTVRVRNTPPPNRRPVANAGPNQTVNEGATVTLDGSGSSDPDRDTLSYAWTQTGGPSVTLTGASTASPTFTAPQVTADTNLVLRLTVSDGSLSATDTITVTVQQTNRPPIANAGADQTAKVGDKVTLDGTASEDPEGDSLRYAWTQTSGPSVILYDKTLFYRTDTERTVSFRAPAPPSNADVEFSLVVTDEHDTASAAATVAVTILGAVLTEDRDDLLDDWASRYGRGGDVCAEWGRLHQTEREIFVWNTHRLHITDMLPGVTGLHAIFGRDPRGGCGGGEYNRTFMSMTTQLRDKLLLISRNGSRTVLPTWRETLDPACDWRGIFLPSPCPHPPFSHQVETDPGSPRGQIQFFGEPDMVIVSRQYRGFNYTTGAVQYCGVDSVRVNRADVCPHGTSCPGSGLYGGCADQYSDTIVVDPRNTYSRGPAGRAVPITDELSFEMDQDYGTSHKSAPSCNGMKDTYSEVYGDPNWHWRPTACGGSGPLPDTPFVPRATSVRAVHVTELRERVDALRGRFGLAPFTWTDSTIVPEVTLAKAVHVMELRTALEAAYRAAGRDVPTYTDAWVSPHVTLIRLVHMTELRQAVVALEQ